MSALSARKEVILLNLKWFVKRLPKTFEGLLEHRRSSHPSTSFLSLLYRYPTDDRIRALLRFAVHTALVYEYQLALLRDYNAIKAVVNYVAAFVLRCFEIGELKDLQPSHFNPTLFLTAAARVSEGHKIVKTSPVGAHRSSLSWKVSDIFTKPALRHHAIHFVNSLDAVHSSLETQHLSPFTPFGRSVLPETYGFRNVIAALEEKEQCYRLFNEDACTLHRCRVRSFDYGEDTSKLHFHMSYRPLFLLIYANVGEPSWTHLESCASFRRFCQQQECRPVLFHSAPLRPHAELRYLFDCLDLFGLSFDSGYGESPSSSPDLDSVSSSSSGLSRGIDNPAFVI